MENSKTLPASVELLASRRNGGKVNLRGIEYQLLYSIYQSLTVLGPDVETVIRLEGVEDLDVLHKLYVSSQQFYQLKFTSDKLTASSFNKFGIIQNL